MRSAEDILTRLETGSLSRRRLMQALLAAVAPAIVARRAVAGQAPANEIGPLDPAVLPRGVRSRFVNNVNGLRFHVLEAGFETPGRPAVLLLHGYPELAYSWRKAMPPLAAAGYHVIVPDVRGFGRTSPAPVSYDADLRPFGTMNKVVDMLSLVSALGYRTVAAVVGHDAGSPLAGWCALTRPDIFRSVVMMSAPFGGAPSLPFNTADVRPAAAPPAGAGADKIYDDLAALTPPRKHYQRYYTTREANENMWHAKQGLHDFIRAYYHMKSADWKDNKPFRLQARTASEWAKMPRYYIMDLNKSMAETVAAEMPTAAEIAACKWLTEAELKVYTEEYGRTGFQGGLNGYRGGGGEPGLQIFAGHTIDVPSSFMAGKSDWGVFQNPGAIERLETTVCTKYEGTHLVEGAGHWVQQEQPEALNALLLQFLKRHA